MPARATRGPDDRSMGMNNSPSHRPYTAIGALAIALSVLAAEPVAAKCLDDVHVLAESQGLSSQPPVAAPDSKQARGTPPVTTHQLSRSGGVIAPPPVDDKGVIKPPGNTDPGMATLPNAQPAPSGQGPASPPGAESRKDKAGANRSALQAALTAARAAAERGDEQACRESLAKAELLAEKP